MASVYGTGALDTLPTNHDDTTHEVIHASTDNDQSDAINKVELMLGANPKGSDADVETRLDRIDTALVSVVEGPQGGTAYTLALADAGRVVATTGSADTTVTVPADATVAFPVGTVLELAQLGSGTLIVAAAAGVTLHTPTGTLRAAGQFSSLFLRKRGTDEWVITGDLYSQVFFPPPPASGDWLRPIGPNASGNAAINNRITYTPVLLAPQAYKTVALWLETAGNAGSVCRCGLYADNGHGAPGALLREFGTVAIDTATGQKSIDLSASPLSIETLEWAWLAGKPENMATTAAVIRALGTSGATLASLGFPLADPWQNYTSYYEAAAGAGALPANATPVRTAFQFPILLALQAQ